MFETLKPCIFLKFEINKSSEANGGLEDMEESHCHRRCGRDRVRNRATSEDGMAASQDERMGWQRPRMKGWGGSVSG